MPDYDFEDSEEEEEEHPFDCMCIDCLGLPVILLNLETGEATMTTFGGSENGLEQ